MTRRRLLLVLVAGALLMGASGAITRTEFDALKARVSSLETRVSALENAAWPSPSPTATSSPSSSPTSSPSPSPSATPTGVTVASIPALLSALADDSVTSITVAPGTYHVSAAASQYTDSLWIGSRFASRTHPVTVTATGVTFDGGGTSYFGCLSFEEGAHDQTWTGFTCANGEPTQTGVITFGDYAGLAPAHDITLRDVTMATSITSDTTGVRDHYFYFGQALSPGVRGILIDGLSVTGLGGSDTVGVDSVLHFFGSSAGNPNVSGVTVRNMHATGTDQAVIVWDSTATGIVIEDSTIANATRFAVRYEGGSVTFRNVTSTGSGEQGFYSSLGTNPPGVTFIGCSFQ